MKRALAALAALWMLAVVPARAQVIVIGGPMKLNDSNFAIGENTLEQVYLSALYETNANFTFVRAEQLVNGAAGVAGGWTVNQYLRAGQYWPLGVGVGTPITYRGIIDLGVSGSATYGAYRPDSATLVGNASNGNYWPTVPRLMIANGQHTTNAFATVTKESTGVAGHISYSVVQDSTLNVYQVGKPSRTWKAYTGNVVKSPRIVRGWRPLIGTISTRPVSGPTDGNYDEPRWTTSYPTDPDTAAAWIVYNYASGTNTPIAGTVLGVSATAAPIAYFNVTRGATSDIDGGLVLASLQVLDSLSGGALFGSSGLKLPLKVGVHIDAGWKRSESNKGETGAGGIADADFPALRRAIRKMNDLEGFKYGLGVEVDSLWAYKGVDETYWHEARNARLTPHVHAGQNSNAPAPPQNAGTKYILPINIWGLNLNARMRYAFGGPENVDSMLVYGVPDYVAAPTDTMVTYWLSKRAFALCDSISHVMWGAVATDHLVMPPADDWTNQRITHGADSTYTVGSVTRNSVVNSVDSVLAAAALSGATGVRSNLNSANSATIHNASGNSGYGYYQAPRYWNVGPASVPSTFPTRVYGTPCNVIGTVGYPNTTYSSPNPVGSRRSWSAQVRGKPGDFQDVLYGAMGVQFGVETFSSVNGWTATTVKGIPTAAQNIVGNILAIHVADLGSNGVEDTMPGYYNFKYLASAIAVANSYGRQKVIKIVWPEEVQP